MTSHKGAKGKIRKQTPSLTVSFANNRGANGLFIDLNICSHFTCKNCIFAAFYYNPFYRNVLLLVLFSCGVCIFLDYLKRC